MNLESRLSRRDLIKLGIGLVSLPLTSCAPATLTPDQVKAQAEQLTGKLISVTGLMEHVRDLPENDPLNNMLQKWGFSRRPDGCSFRELFRIVDPSTFNPVIGRGFLLAEIHSVRFGLFPDCKVRPNPNRFKTAQVVTGYLESTPAPTLEGGFVYSLYANESSIRPVSP